MKYQLQDSKYEFLIEEFFMFSLNAGLQTRNKEFPIYKSEIKDSDKTNGLKKDIRDFLLKYLSDYESIDENQHIQKITELSDTISEKYSKMIYNNRFRIGISQKIINLFLKYMWAVGKIDRPYHCPIDNIVKLLLQKEAKGNSFKDWTEMDDIEDYKNYIENINTIAKDANLTIPEWELENWSRK